MKERKGRDSFRSSLGVLLAMAGSAVGLGNLWRLPYLVGENGGAAFIIIYLIAIVFLSIPVFISEFMIGRRAQANVFSACKNLSPRKEWGIIGVFCLLSVFCILSFYSVVGGWSVNYLGRAIIFQFTRENGSAELETMFSNFVENPWLPLIFHTVFLLLTSIIVILGIQKGIEKFSKVMMPVLFFIIVLIAIRSLTLDGASSGINYLFKPDFSKITAQTVIAALGQAFFSLSIGCGTIMTYGSYVSRDENLLKCSVGTVLSDTLFALIAGCAIMPAVFAFGISPSEGPGLVFITLPHIFSQMHFGGVIAVAFFFTLLLAALTSSISLLEVVVAFAVESLKMSRKKAVISSFSLFWTIGALCSLSQGRLSDFTIFGKNIFDLLDYISANILMLGGGLLTVIFTGWVLGRKVIEEELTNRGAIHYPPRFVNGFIFMIKYIAPIVIIAILLATYGVF